MIVSGNLQTKKTNNNKNNKTKKIVRKVKSAICEFHTSIYRVNGDCAYRVLANSFNAQSFKKGFLPNKIKLKEYANIIADMQSECFGEKDKETNIQRIIDLFDPNKMDEPASIIILSLGYYPTAKDYTEYVIGASAVLQLSAEGIIPSSDDSQYSSVSVSTSNEIKQPIINEVCKHYNITGSTKCKTKAPVRQVFNITEKYIVNKLMVENPKIDGAYLYVEKESDTKTDHVSDVLIKIYNKKGYVVYGNDEEYIYMKKELPSKKQ